jgi:hypothetical protein
MKANSVIDTGFIVADGCVVECFCNGEGLVSFVLQLLMAYYAWDLNYPKEYQLLSFLQIYFLKDTAIMPFKGTNLTKMEFKFKELMTENPDPQPDNID